MHAQRHPSLANLCPTPFPLPPSDTRHFCSPQWIPCAHTYHPLVCRHVFMSIDSVQAFFIVSINTTQKQPLNKINDLKTDYHRVIKHPYLKIFLFNNHKAFCTLMIATKFLIRYM